MLNATPLKPSAGNVRNTSMNFGAKIAQSKTNIFAAKPEKDEFLTTKKEEKKPSLKEKIKNFFALPPKKEPATVKK